MAAVRVHPLPPHSKEVIGGQKHQSLLVEQQTCRLRPPPVPADIDLSGCCPENLFLGVRDGLSGGALLWGAPPLCGGLHAPNLHPWRLQLWLGEPKAWKGLTILW